MSAATQRLIDEATPDQDASGPFPNSCRARWQRPKLVFGRPWIRSLSSLILCWASAAPAAYDERAAQIDRIRSLARAGRHDNAEAQAQSLLDVLPPDDRPYAWSIDLNGRLVHDARIGRNHVYLMRMVSAPNPGGYGWMIGVTCVDGAAGRPLWSRNLVPPTRLAIDPRDDALWTWERDEGASILRIDADTGAETIRGRMPRHTQGVDAVRGLRVGGLELWSAPTANEIEAGRGDELEVETGHVRRNAIHPALLSANGPVLREIVFQSPEDVSTTVSLIPAADGDRGVPSWSFRSGGYVANPPVWFGDDVLILAGTSDSYGAVSRLDGRTGKSPLDSCSA